VNRKMWLREDEKNQGFIESDKRVGTGNFRRTVYVITYYTIFQSVVIAQKPGKHVSTLKLELNSLKSQLDNEIKNYESLKKSGKFPYIEKEYQKKISVCEETIRIFQGRYIEIHNEWLKLSGNDIIE
jgi:hypothetical protein